MQHNSNFTKMIYLIFSLFCIPYSILLPLFLLIQPVNLSICQLYPQKGLKRVLMEAVEELSSLMVDDDLLSEEELDDIMVTAMSADDDDSDLMPPGW